MLSSKNHCLMFPSMNNRVKWLWFLILKQRWNSSERSGWCWLSQHLVSVPSSTLITPKRLFYASLFSLCFKRADRVAGQQRSRACSRVVTDGIQILPKIISSRRPHFHESLSTIFTEAVWEQFINAADTQLQPDISFSLLFKIQRSPTALSPTRRETSEWFS